MNGFAYVFLKLDGAPIPVGCAGHVGWGFSMHMAPNNMDAVCGATENPSGQGLILPGQDIGYWDARTDLEEQMVFLFKRRNYHAFKRVKVDIAYPDNALKMARQQALGGYALIGNNCLDHVWRVLNAYGVRDLPLAQFFPSPTHWFGEFRGDYFEI